MHSEHIVLCSDTGANKPGVVIVSTADMCTREYDLADDDTSDPPLRGTISLIFLSTRSWLRDFGILVIHHSWDMSNHFGMTLYVVGLVRPEPHFGLAHLGRSLLMAAWAISGAAIGLPTPVSLVMGYQGSFCAAQSPPSMQIIQDA